VGIWGVLVFVYNRLGFIEEDSGGVRPDNWVLCLRAPLVDLKGVVETGEWDCYEGGGWLGFVGRGRTGVPVLCDEAGGGFGMKIEGGVRWGCGGLGFQNLDGRRSTLRKLSRSSLNI